VVPTGSSTKQIRLAMRYLLFSGGASHFARLADSIGVRRIQNRFLTPSSNHLRHGDDEHRGGNKKELRITDLTHWKFELFLKLPAEFSDVYSQTAAFRDISTARQESVPLGAAANGRIAYVPRISDRA
jgi:hypothetical protein